MMKLRAASVRNQLASLEAKTFPRLPSCTSDNEKCQAWEAVRPPVINVRAEGQIFPLRWLSMVDGGWGGGRSGRSGRRPVLLLYKPNNFYIV